MGLFLDAAIAWNQLQDITYILDIGRKGKLYRIFLTFLPEDFPHLAGMQYANDVDFRLHRAEYYGARLIPALLNKQLADGKIEESRHWEKIAGRLTAILHLQDTLDKPFTITAFSKAKVRPYSQIDAKFVIKSSVSEDIFFVFLDERSGRYYCKSAFRKENTDYMENQSPMTILQKTKIDKGLSHILFTKPGYEPMETI